MFSKVRDFGKATSRMYFFISTTHTLAFLNHKSLCFSNLALFNNFHVLTSSGFLLYPDTPAKMETTSREAFCFRPIPQQDSGKGRQSVKRVLFVWMYECFSKNANSVQI